MVDVHGVHDALTLVSSVSSTASLQEVMRLEGIEGAAQKTVDNRLILKTLEWASYQKRAWESEDINAEIARLKTDTNAADPAQLKKIAYLKMKLDIWKDPEDGCARIDSQKVPSEEDLLEMGCVAALRDPEAVCRNIDKFRFENPQNQEKLFGLLISLCPTLVWDYIEKFSSINKERLADFLVVLADIDPEGVFVSLEKLKKMSFEPNALAGIISEAVAASSMDIWLDYIEDLNTIHSNLMEKILEKLAIKKPHVLCLYIEKIPIKSCREVAPSLARVFKNHPQLILENLEKFSRVHPCLIPDIFACAFLLTPTLVLTHLDKWASYIDEAIPVEAIWNLNRAVAYAFFQHSKLIVEHLKKLAALSSHFISDLISYAFWFRPELAIKHISDWEDYIGEKTPIPVVYSLALVLGYTFISHCELMVNHLQQLHALHPALVLGLVNFASAHRPDLVMKYVKDWIHYIDEKEVVKILKTLMLWNPNEVKDCLVSLGLSTKNQEKLLSFGSIFPLG